MLKVVFDTVILVRALINPSSICGSLISDYSEHYRLFVSEPVAQEMLEVLRRPELVTKFRTLGVLDLTRVIDLLGEAEVVDLQDAPQVSRDPKDDKFLATAEAAKADYLVSEDKDLLVVREYRGVRIVQAEAFLRVLQEESK